MSSSNPKEGTSRVRHFTLWVTFSLPATYSLELFNPETVEDQAFYSILRMLQTELQPDYTGGVLGRVKEAPESVLLASQWRTKDSLDAFMETKEYKKQMDMINEISTSLAECEIVDLPNDFGRSRLNHVEIIDTSFAFPVPDTIFEKLTNLRPLHYGFGISGGGSPYDRRPMRGWVERASNSQPTQTLRFINFWKDVDREREFKETVVWSGWNEKVKDYGAISLKNIHYKLESVPTRFYEIENIAKGRALEAEEACDAQEREMVAGWRKLEL